MQMSCCANFAAAGDACWHWRECRTATCLAHVLRADLKGVQKYNQKIAAPVGGLGSARSRQGSVHGGSMSARSTSSALGEGGVGGVAGSAALSSGFLSRTSTNPDLIRAINPLAANSAAVSQASGMLVVTGLEARLAASCWGLPCAWTCRTPVAVRSCQC